MQSFCENAIGGSLSDVKIEKIEKAKVPEKPKHILKLGDRVRLIGSKSVGTLDKIEKGKALVNYGMFTTSSDLDKLELVEAVKKKG